MSVARQRAAEHPTPSGRSPPANESVARKRKNALVLANTPEAAALKTRSAVTNGKRLHVVRPGDTAWGRRFKDVLSNILSDVSEGGFNTLSEGQKQLARRCALISIECERMEGQAASGAEIDLESYGQLTDRLGRALQRLGIRRQSRDVTPTLESYLHAKGRDAYEVGADE